MMRAPSTWPEGLDSVWAKSPAPGQPRGETLAEHTWNLLARLADLARLRPNLPARASLPRLWLLLARAAWIHDWGKAARGFQAMLRGGRTWPHRHEVLSLLWVDWCARDLDAGEATWLAAAVASHHKDADELLNLYPLGLAEEDDPVTELVAEVDPVILQALWRWQHDGAARWVEELGLADLGIAIPPPPPWEDALARVQREGVRRVHHWLRRYHRLVDDLGSEPMPLTVMANFLLRGYLLQADHTASAHVHLAASPDWRREHVLRACALAEGDLYEHQRIAGATRGSAILMAPTGSGKTEAALLWAACQVQAGEGVPRLFYTLPYQASMNAMYDRLLPIFPELVGLVHSRAALALYRRFMDQAYSPQEATRLARSLRELARLHVQPVRVFSPYQMLKAAYQLKGHEAMWADYAQGVFVFDEIHAYEPERLAMILEMVAHLRERWGARFLVMSATLPAPVRERVMAALGDAACITAAPELFQAFTRHQPYLSPGELLDEENLAMVVDAWQAGASVLVTCNTVARAQAVYQALREHAPWAGEDELILVHGRFNGRDRLAKERRIVAATALGQRPQRMAAFVTRPAVAGKERPVLVVSTQVVEVSLNIDMDILFSDPAPLEALIQRFGRVNRRRRVSLAPVYVFQQPDDGLRVYDPALVRAALDILADQAGRPLDEAQVQGWLDAIYTGEALARWEARYARTAAEFREAFLDTARPYRSDPALERAFERLFDGLEVLPKGLVDEYQAFLEADDPLGASQLLVPIRWGQYHALANEGRILPPGGDLPYVVDAYYDAEIGLDPQREMIREEW